MALPALAPGFRFRPTEEELVGHYLRRRARGSLAPSERGVILEGDLLGLEPWDLVRRLGHPSALGEAPLECFFFWTPRGRGPRTNRCTPQGYWKATGPERPAGREGVKKSLVFYLGRGKQARKTDWMLYEYKLQGHNAGALAVCRIFPKPGSPTDLRAVQVPAGTDATTAPAAASTVVPYPAPAQADATVDQFMEPESALEEEAAPAFSLDELDLEGEAGILEDMLMAQQEAEGEASAEGGDAWGPATPATPSIPLAPLSPTPRVHSNNASSAALLLATPGEMAASSDDVFLGLPEAAELAEDRELLAELLAAPEGQGVLALEEEVLETMAELRGLLGSGSETEAEAESVVKPEGLDEDALAYEDGPAYEQGDGSGLGAEGGTVLTAFLEANGLARELVDSMDSLEEDEAMQAWWGDGANTPGSILERALEVGPADDLRRRASLAQGSREASGMRTHLRRSATTRGPSQALSSVTQQSILQSTEMSEQASDASQGQHVQRTPPPPPRLPRAPPALGSPGTGREQALVGGTRDAAVFTSAVEETAGPVALLSSQEIAAARHVTGEFPGSVEAMQQHQQQTDPELLLGDRAEEEQHLHLQPAEHQPLLAEVSEEQPFVHSVQAEHGLLLVNVDQEQQHLRPLQVELELLHNEAAQENEQHHPLQSDHPVGGERQAPLVAVRGERQPRLQAVDEERQPRLHAVDELLPVAVTAPPTQALAAQGGATAALAAVPRNLREEGLLASAGSDDVEPQYQGSGADLECVCQTHEETETAQDAADACTGDFEELGLPGTEPNLTPVAALTSGVPLSAPAGAVPEGGMQELQGLEPDASDSAEVDPSLRVSSGAEEGVTFRPQARPEASLCTQKPGKQRSSGSEPVGTGAELLFIILLLRTVGQQQLTSMGKTRSGTGLSPLRWGVAPTAVLSDLGWGAVPTLRVGVMA